MNGSKTQDKPTVPGLYLRAGNGRCTRVPEDYRFVEMRDEQGDIAFVVHTDSQGATHVVLPNTPAARRYETLYRVKFCGKFVDLRETTKDPNKNQSI
jgi:hypothetical protein